MARPNKVWYRLDIGWWMVTIGGKKERLLQGPKDEHHRQLAEEKFVELRRLRRIAPESIGARTADVIEAFLRHSRVHFAEDTHRINRYYCQLFAEACGQVSAREIKPYHVARWIDPKVEAEEWGETTVYNARKAAFRVFSWAAECKLLPENPLAGMKRPKPQPRQRAITESEFWTLHEYAGEPLRNVLLSLYLTGARPKEVRELQWQQVREDRWELGKHKTSRHTSRKRVIFIPPPIRDLTDRLKGNGSDFVFLNTEGEPWTMSALRQQIWRLRTKLGMAKDVCAYLCRHGFGTRAILSGVSGPTLAQLMGHASQEMISKVYVHLAEEHQHLAEAVEQVMPSMPSPAEPSPARKRARPVNPKKPGPKPAA